MCAGTWGAIDGIATAKMRRQEEKARYYRYSLFCTAEEMLYRGAILLVMRNIIAKEENWVGENAE